MWQYRPALNPITQETQTRGLVMNSRAVWAAEQVPSRPVAEREREREGRRTWPRQRSPTPSALNEVKIKTTMGPN